jgi:Flp pilus assembly protein protease CpaA
VRRGGRIFYAIAVSPREFSKEGMGGGDIKLAAMMSLPRLASVAIYVRCWSAA